jgi:hypothetical protein
MGWVVVLSLFDARSTTLPLTEPRHAITGWLCYQFQTETIMSSRLIPAAGAALYLLLSGSSMASPCTDRINTIEARVNEAAEATASVSSGGQGVAAARESQAMQARNQGAPIATSTVPPFQNEAREAQTTQQAAQAGGGGDRVMQARATLNQARTFDERGESAACLETVTQAERQLGSP